LGYRSSASDGQTYSQITVTSQLFILHLAKDCLQKTDKRSL